MASKKLQHMKDKKPYDLANSKNLLKKAKKLKWPTKMMQTAYGTITPPQSKKE